MSGSQWEIQWHLGVGPTDVVVLFATVLFADVLVFALPGGHVGRILGGLFLVLIAPGYALLAAIYPEAAEPLRQRRNEDDGRTRIDLTERMALSVGLSFALAVFCALAVAAVNGRVDVGSVLLLLNVTVGVFGAIGFSRGLSLPSGRQFADRTRMRGESVVTSLKRRRKPRESMLDAAVAIVAVLSLVAVLSGLLVPVDGESYTDLAVLTENGSDDLLAGEYPTELEPNEEAPLVAAIENHENRRTNYTLVVELQRVERGDESLAVRERQELLQERASLDHGEQWHVEHEVAPELTGENLRLQYRLYRGSATDDATPYREVHLWLSVAED